MVSPYQSVVAHHEDIEPTIQHIKDIHHLEHQGLVVPADSLYLLSEEEDNTIRPEEEFLAPHHSTKSTEANKRSTFGSSLPIESKDKEEEKADIFTHLDNLTQSQDEQKRQHSELKEKLSQLEEQSSIKEKENFTPTNYFHSKVIDTHNQRPSTIFEESSRGTTPMESREHSISAPAPAHTAHYHGVADVNHGLNGDKDSKIIQMDVFEQPAKETKSKRMPIYKNIPAITSIMAGFITFIIFCLLIANKSINVSNIRITAIFIAVGTFVLEVLYTAVYIRKDRKFVFLVKPRIVDMIVILSILAFNFAAAIMIPLFGMNYTKEAPIASVRAITFLGCAIIGITALQLYFRIREMLKDRK